MHLIVPLHLAILKELVMLTFDRKKKKILERLVNKKNLTVILEKSYRDAHIC